MVIPCAPYDAVDPSKFCPLKSGNVVPMWLTKYAAVHKHDKLWLLVPLCIFTFITFGGFSVNRYKMALRNEDQREFDLWLQENEHLFDNGAVEAFLVPESHRNGYSPTINTHRVERISSSGNSDDNLRLKTMKQNGSDVSSSYDHDDENAVTCACLCATFKCFDRSRAVPQAKSG
ncbi:hypothetical protein CCR75_001757 [Bremia lactucae]|uniref:Uncharacterized protein n=1 Tax=Bremia lactucae TaxID=4779 RepID=A0A976NXD7_BRELC|nr:hypothetical protein CCR75_001757 [Bremia lactucae]